ncbi:hypothetical protein LCGC14_1352240 [marine sediment metagenome]|uniref:Uncharacterized protein n=1 Tax=marine sediment metagenome TaxID=412755 RepID=A0A0F9KWM6_9ZZZZ
MLVSDLFIGAKVWTKVSGKRRRVVVISETRETRGHGRSGRRERFYQMGHLVPSRSTGEARVEPLPILRSAKQLHKCGHGYDAFAPLGVAANTVPVCIDCQSRYDGSVRAANRDSMGVGS